jgi:low temperature requirement protein LtrA
VSEQAFEVEHRITPIELFFDLVFVFAFTQVTFVFLHDPTWRGIGQGLLILTTLWWAWASYAWLTNSFDAGDDMVLAALLIAMAGMFVAALAVPEAFGSHGVVFGVAFLVVAAMHVTLYAVSARTEPEFFRAVLHIIPASLGGALLILIAGFADGGWKAALWIAALGVGFFGPFFVDVSSWRLAPAHFIERHGLIVIIAIGESLVAIGLGARTTSLDAGVIVAALLGLSLATGFWLAYFDFFPIRAQQLLAERTGAARIALARDVYTYLHLPMVAAIVLFAFALEITLAHVGAELQTIPAFALCVGPAIYLFSFVGLRYRVSRTLGRGRSITALACIAVFPLALAIPALAALAVITGIWVTFHTYELLWWRDERARTRTLRSADIVRPSG